eukprot:Pgem_evm1s3801
MLFPPCKFQTFIEDAKVLELEKTHFLVNALVINKESKQIINVEIHYTKCHPTYTQQMAFFDK